MRRIGKETLRSSSLPGDMSLYQLVPFRHVNHNLPAAPKDLVIMTVRIDIMTNVIRKAHSNESHRITSEHRVCTSLSKQNVLVDSSYRRRHDLHYTDIPHRDSTMTEAGVWIFISFHRISIGEDEIERELVKRWTEKEEKRVGCSSTKDAPIHHRVSL